MKKVLKGILEINIKLEDKNITRQEVGKYNLKLIKLENQVDDLELKCFYSIVVFPTLRKI